MNGSLSLFAGALLIAPMLVQPLAMAQAASSSSWLDDGSNWNQTGAAIPQAPSTEGGNNLSNCAMVIRQATLPEDKLVMAAGWTLSGAAQVYDGTVVITGMTNADGMCRPLGYQVFVFTNGVFSGTLSPQPMDARSDGSLSSFDLYREGFLNASFNRYETSDPLCCPSRESLVFYEVKRQGNGAVLEPQLPASTNSSRYAQ